MPQFKCPRCQMIINAADPAGLVCPNCGFPGPDTRGPAAPLPQFAPAPAPAPMSQPMYQTTSGYQAPMPMGQPMPYPGAPGQAPAIQGKPRSFGISLLLVIVTLGIYAWVWNYKVFAEMNRQHGREHQQVWFWLGLVPYLGFIFWIVYWVKEIRKLNEIRQQYGLQPGISGAAMALWNTLGILLLLLGPFIGYYQLTKSVNQLWQQVYQRAGVPYPG